MAGVKAAAQKKVSWQFVNNGKFKPCKKVNRSQDSTESIEVTDDDDDESIKSLDSYHEGQDSVRSSIHELQVDAD